MAPPTYEEKQALDFTVGGITVLEIAPSSTAAANGIDFLVGGIAVIATSPGGTPPVTYNATQFFMLF